MIIALAFSMMGMIIIFAYQYGIITNPWFFILGATVAIMGLLVASILWDDIKDRIKKLEEKVKENDKRREI